MLLELPALQPAGRTAVITPDEAFARLQARGVVTSAPAASIDVTEVELAFFVPFVPDGPHEAAAELIQPVYVFRGVAQLQDNKREAFTEYIQAARLSA